MPHHFFIFFILLLLIAIPNADAETVRAYLLADEGQTGGNSDDEIIVENNEPVKLDPVTVTETTETVGGVEVDLTQEVQFVATDGNVVTLKNTALPTTTVEIPNGAFVSGPAAWNGQLTTPTQISTSGSVPTAFQTPTTSIQMGSPDVILIFNQAVTILLPGTTGQTAYKLAGSSTWILISGCTGTYANPNDPPENGECAISNGIDTKILTFHFTEFTGLSSTPPSTPAVSTPSTSSSGSSGGHGRTGVGPSSGGGYSGPGLVYDIPEKPIIPGMPKWFNAVIIWQQQGLISTDEMLQAWKWLKAQ